ncbi:chaperone protein DNAj, putative [Ricinus communis]|uniref:Chaperone protein DNAj, putative n=1 Tax=Ricinus communis TaxID=3988 RepID=B9SHF6_RICCO|nr:chaperone protein DNAj, putative [Ricinus communis]
MQALLLVGPIPTALEGSGAISSSSSSFIAGVVGPAWCWAHHRNRLSHHLRKWSSVAAASSSRAAANDEQDHYAVLGLTRNATSADIKQAYRLLARKYHPDVSKHSQAGQLFMSVRNAYEILSNEVTRTQYDRVLRFQEDNGRSYRGESYYSPEFEDGLRIYKWAELRRKMQRERRWERYDVNDENSDSESDMEEVAEEGIMDQERGPFSEKLDAGYKIGYFIAWVLGGRGGILLMLCLQFASWACGKTSSSIVALTVVAMWVGSNLARYAPLPQGALLTLLYMSIKLQADLK